MSKTKDTYGNYMNRKNQNTKCLGASFYNIDTIRGCPNNCESCYAKKNSAISVANFEIPIKIEKFVGALQKDAWYRIGNSGDPATDWKYSEELIKTWCFKKFFCVTKLQSLKGFSGYFDKLQVSVDPLNRNHLITTLRNTEIILKRFPHVKVIFRIRSVSTKDTKIARLQEDAVAFANQLKIPVMETRMRFNKKNAIEKYSLNTEDYFFSKGKQIKPNWGVPFLKGVLKYYDCDLKGYKCANCPNCIQPWTDKEYLKEGEFIANGGL